MQQNFPMKTFFHEEIFWRTLLSAGEQKPEDKKQIIFRTFFWTENNFQQWKFFWKIWYEISMGYRGRIKLIKMFFFRRLVFLEMFFQEQFFERTCYQWGDRGPMIEKKNYNLEKKLFSLMFILLKKTLFVLVWFINGGRQNWCHEQKLKFRIPFIFKKKFSSKSVFEWHSYKWVYGRQMIERRNFDLKIFFSQKMIFQKTFD